MMLVAHDLFFGIAIGAAPIAAGFPAAPYRGAIDRQPNRAAVFKCFVSLGPMHGIDQSLSGACRVQPFGEVAQSIVSEAGLQAQLSGPRVTHQLFDGEETDGAQPLSGEQGPEQSSSRLARLRSAIAAILEKALQPQTLHRVMRSEE